MIPRPGIQAQLDASIRDSPVTALLGPRQSGKTTLARAVAETTGALFLDLEDPTDRARLSAPMQVLGNAPGLVILDEIQRQPDLFELLRVLVDRPDKATRFLVLGSASPTIVRGVSESLAGRVRFVDLGGFQLGDVGVDRRDTLWARGGLPRSFLSESDEASLRWREDFIRTFLERDLPQLGITIPAETLRRFWTMLAHFHGQVWNGADLARSLGSSEPTARRYLDLLAGAFMIRILPPWFENIRKRQVKSPKIYLRDSGLLHALLQLPTLTDIQSHPKLGASWEGFALEQFMLETGSRDAYFWATHSGAELDLLILAHGKRYGFEFKYADAPRRTRSMLVALEDLGLDSLTVVVPGSVEYDLHDKIRVRSLAAALEGIGSDRTGP